MKELKLIRDKISTRINSMANDEKGIYAKRMMRRCIKDIDQIVGAKEIVKRSASDTIKRCRDKVLQNITADKTNPTALSEWIVKNVLGARP